MAYQGGLTYAVLATNSTTLSTAVATQTASLKVLAATNTITVLNNSVFYAGSTLGYVFITVYSKFNNPPAPVYNINGVPTWTILSSSDTTLSGLSTKIETSLNSGITTYQNSAPLITEYQFAWDGTNLVAELFVNYQPGI